MRVPSFVLGAAIFGFTAALAWAHDESHLIRTSSRLTQLETGASVQGVFFPYRVDATSLHPIAIAVAVDGAAEVEESKRWRRILAVGGVAGGFFAYMPVALSDTRVGISDAQRILEWSAVTTGAAVLGYVIGKKLDRR